MACSVEKAQHGFKNNFYICYEAHFAEIFFIELNFGRQYLFDIALLSIFIMVKYLLFIPVFKGSIIGNTGLD